MSPEAVKNIIKVLSVIILGSAIYFYQKYSGPLFMGKLLSKSAVTKSTCHYLDIELSQDSVQEVSGEDHYIGRVLHEDKLEEKISILIHQHGKNIAIPISSRQLLDKVDCPEILLKETY